MKIAIIAHNLRTAGGLTVGSNTIAALRRVADEHEYFLTLPADAGYEAIALPTRSKPLFFRRRPGARGVAAQLWLDFVRLNGLVAARRPDVVWGLGNFGLPRPPCPQAVLCQDAHFVYEPTQQPRVLWTFTSDLRVARTRLRRSLPNSQLVFCQTNVMIRRFRETFQFAGEMSLFPAAVSRIASEPNDAPPRIYEQLKGRFVLLALTRYYRHKNLELLIEMFERHPAELADVSVVLTIDPPQGYGADEFLRRIANSPAREHFVNVGPVRRTELAAYYNGAAALITPTVLETTCLPYLEAMQYGTPILTGDLDFSREMCGDAAFYFDPWNADSAFEAVMRFRADPSIGPALVACGRKRVEQHFRTWDEIVRDAITRLETLQM
ncbi:MAG: glycosyltransferase [Planctomycetes bacterium]|nr:glycosyltransferase [Planctomycetota bacterium]